MTLLIERTLEEKNVCTAVLLDVSQAFDKGLLSKLCTQLQRAYCTLFKSYLSNRLFHFKYEKEYSKLIEIQAGIPKGSILGPLLYVFYTNDTFADDTAILSVATTENEAKYKLKNALTSVLEHT